MNLRDELYETVVGLRFPDGVYCQNCGSRSISLFKTKHSYYFGKCMACYNNVSPFAGTGLDNCKLSIAQICNMVDELCENPKISSVQLGKKIGITQKTAYNHKMRLLPIVERNQRIGIEVLKDVLTVPKNDIVSGKMIKPNTLSRAQIISIRDKFEKGTNMKKLALLFKRDISTIGRIVRKDSYATEYYKKREKRKKGFSIKDSERLVVEIERVFGKLDDTGELNICASMFLFGTLNNVHDPKELWMRTLYDEESINKWVGNLTKYEIWVDGRVNADLDYDKMDLSFFTELLLCCMTATGSVVRIKENGEDKYGLPEWKKRSGGSNFTPKKKRRK